MSRLDQRRPAKRVKHAHAATGGNKIVNGIDALLEPNFRLDNDKRLKASLSNDKTKKSRLTQLDESRTVVQANGDVEMQDGPASLVEISSDSPSSSIDNSEDEGIEEKHVNGIGKHDDSSDVRSGSLKNNLLNTNGNINESQSLKSLARSKRPREKDNVEGEDDENEAMGNNQIAKQNTGYNENVVTEEPSFGELLQAQAPSEPIDVTSAYETSGKNYEGSLTHRKSRIAPSTSPTHKPHAGPITANSLGTVLTQALRTNDNDLLESCLGLTDYAGVRATIERLPSHLATVLLLRLAERLHRRPGRAGNLMIWVQWSLVAHGGYLASQPAAVAQLAVLRRVVRERADGLQPLLRLKGKLDMLAAQLELRKKMKRRRPERDASVDDEGEEDDDAEDDDEGIIYVEGAEKDDDDDDDVEGDLNKPGDEVMIIDADDDDADEHTYVESKQRNKKRRRRKERSDSDFHANPSTTKSNKTNNSKPTGNRDNHREHIQNEEAGSSSSEIDAMPTTAAASGLVNGVHGGSSGLSDEDDDDEDEGDENLIDDEAEETDRDTGDDEEDGLSEGSDLDGFIDDGEDLEEEDEEEEEDEDEMVDDEEDGGDEIDEVDDDNDNE